MPISTNVPKSNSSARGSDSMNIFIIIGTVVGFIILLIIIAILCFFAMLWKPQRRIKEGCSIDVKASCTINELNTNNGIELNHPMYDVIDHPVYDVINHPVYDVIKPNAADYGTTAKPTISYSASTKCFSKTSEEECSYTQSYEFMQNLSLDEVKNTDPAYAATAKTDCIDTSKEGCGQVQLDEFMPCEPNAVDIQSKGLIQHQDLNGSTKVSIDPAYAGLISREDSALTFSATAMHSNMKPHQSSYNAIVIVEQHDSDACSCTVNAH